MRYTALSKALYQSLYGLSTLDEVSDSIKRQAKFFFDFYHGGQEYYLTDTNSKDLTNFESRTFASVIFNTDNILVIGLNHYEYTGGTHGLGYWKYVSLNTMTAKPLKLEDFFIESDTSELKQLLEKDLRITQGIPDSISLQQSGLNVIGNDVPIPSGYYITSEGVMFIYYGEITTMYAELYVFISFKEMSGIIKRQSWMKF